MACKFTGKVAALRIDNRAVGVRIGIHNLQALFEILATLNAKHGAEHFVTADGHILCNMVKNCGTYEIAVFVAFNNTVPAVQHQFCALFDTFVDIGKHFFVMFFVCNRAEFGGFIPRRADLDFFSLLFKLCNEFIGDCLFNNTAGKCHTTLTCTAVCGVNDTCNGSFQSTVRHNKRMVFRLAKCLTAFACGGGTLINF